MTEIVLLVLAIVWAVVLVPGWIRNFLERGGRRTPMMAWQRQLDTLSRTTPAAGLPAPFGARVLSVDRRGVYQRPRSSVPNNSREAAVRRRDILRLLVLGSAMSLFGWIVGGLTAVGVVHIVLDAALISYLALLNQRRKKEIRRLAQIHYHQPQVALASEIFEEGMGRNPAR